MKKYFLFVITIVLAIFTNRAQAQYYNNTYREDSWHITIGPDFYAVVNPQQPNPKGGTSPAYVNYSRLGLGGSVRAEYYPSPFVGLTIGTGVTFIPKAGSNTSGSNYSLIPFKIGAKAFFSQTMYLAAEAGLGYGTPEYRSSHIVKIVSPGIGYNNNDTGLDINLRYEVDHLKGNYISVLGLHVAYSFDLSN